MCSQRLAQNAIRQAYNPDSVAKLLHLAALNRLPHNLSASTRCRSSDPGPGDCVRAARTLRGTPRYQLTPGQLNFGTSRSGVPFLRVYAAHWWGVGLNSLSSGVPWSTVLSARVPDRTAIGAQEGVKADYAGVLEGSIPPASICKSLIDRYIRSCARKVGSIVGSSRSPHPDSSAKLAIWYRFRNGRNPRLETPQSRHFKPERLGFNLSWLCSAARSTSRRWRSTWTGAANRRRRRGGRSLRITYRI
jgi:hypothetical protein